jgi:hypothetical protein
MKDIWAASTSFFQSFAPVLLFKNHTECSNKLTELGVGINYIKFVVREAKTFQQNVIN